MAMVSGGWGSIRMVVVVTATVTVRVERVGSCQITSVHIFY